MSIEIERRFIVKGEDWKIFAQESQELKQAYLILDENYWTVRVRIIDDEKSYLTIKHPKTGIARYEFEYEIPLKDGLSLWEISSYKIEKTRYKLILNNHTWIIDCFKEANFPLVLSEIELITENQKIEIPPWCENEISHLKELSNAALAKSPISSWPLEKRRSIL